MFFFLVSCCYYVFYFSKKSVIGVVCTSKSHHFLASMLSIQESWHALLTNLGICLITINMLIINFLLLSQISGSLTRYTIKDSMAKRGSTRTISALASQQIKPEHLYINKVSLIVLFLLFKSRN